QPGTAFARAPTAALAGAFIVAWTQSYPRGKVARGREAGEVNPQLRHQPLSGPPAHAWDALEPCHLGRNRADPLRNLGAHPLEAGVQDVDVGEQLGQHEALVRPQVALQRLLEL